MIRTAIIGLTGYGGYIFTKVEPFIKSGDVKMIAAVSLPQVHCPEIKEKLSSMGCTIYPSAEEMYAGMKGKLDLVIIPTSIGSHCPLTVGALAAGANVLVEKPAAGTVQEVQQMIDASKKAGKTVCVGFQDIYRPEVQNIKKRIVGHEFGKVKDIRVAAVWPRPKEYYSRNSWAGKLIDNGITIYDSPANNALAHYLNQAVYLAGSSFEESADIVEVKAEMFRVWEMESFDTISLKAVTSTGIRIHYSVSHASHIGEGDTCDIKVECENGMFHLDSDATYGTNLKGERVVSEHHIGTDAGRAIMVETVIRNLNGEKNPVCTLGIALKHTKLINAMHKDFGIRTIPSEYWKEVDKDGKIFRSVPGMNDIINRTVYSGKTFSEFGVKWAQGK